MLALLEGAPVLDYSGLGGPLIETFETICDINGRYQNQPSAPP
jgi:hypothetical protein